MQGEAGVMPSPPTATCAPPATSPTERGALLVLDEVQTGIGRTGTLVRPPAHDGVVPDVVTLAKAPRRRAADRRLHRRRGGRRPPRPGPARHHVRRQPRVLRRGARRPRHDRLARGCSTGPPPWGATSPRGIEGLGHGQVDHVDAVGILIGIALRSPISTQVTAAARESGYLINNAVPERVRLAPPVVVTDAQLDGFLAALPEVLDQGAAAAEAAGS